MSKNILVTTSRQPVNNMLSVECVQTYPVSVSGQPVNDMLSMECVWTNPLAYNDTQKRTNVYIQTMENFKPFCSSQFQLQILLGLGIHKTHI